jgi:Mg-chelatase subunit ChlI
MLDLQFNPINKFYVGPMQMKANNGVLIIDDLGRQRIRPDELLNRWVVPLDRRIEFLTLAGGRKIEIPFEMLVVFASNLDPAELLDPAFLRRIQTKISIGAVNDDQFCEIFRRVARDHEIDADPALIRDLIALIRESLKLELRGCYPRDLVNQICWSARYEGVPPKIDHSSLMRAVEAYFLPNVK